MRYQNKPYDRQKGRINKEMEVIRFRNNNIFTQSKLIKRRKSMSSASMGFKWDKMITFSSTAGNPFRSQTNGI